MRVSAKPVFETPLKGDVLVVDNDQTVCDNLCMILELEGYRAKGVSTSARLFETLSSSTPSCIVLDLQMPGMSGLEILAELSRRSLKIPVVMMSGKNDLQVAVEAMKLGARDFMLKPFMAVTLVERVRAVLETGKTTPDTDLADKHGLTPREQEVLQQITRGASNKEAGRMLGISPRTVEVHRAHVMSKLGAKNTADLMRIILSRAEAKNRRQDK